jgi:hypothetical protein
MKGRKLFEQAPVDDMTPGAFGLGNASADDGLLAPGATAKAEAVQRVQVGLFGIAAMILLVGLASIIGNQADLTDRLAVPDAAPTTEPQVQAPANNPLADAGVVPDIPAEPSPAPAPEPLVLPPPTGAPVNAPDDPRRR